MTAQVYLPEEILIRRALEAMMTALGPVETARFLNLPRQRDSCRASIHRAGTNAGTIDRSFRTLTAEPSIHRAVPGQSMVR